MPITDLQETMAVTPLQRDFKLMRRAAVPLLAVSTPDPAACARKLAHACNGDVPVIVWDCVTGPRAANDKGQDALVAFQPSQCDPVSLLNEALKLPPRSVVILAGMGMILTASPDQSALCQAVLNLRDPFKSDGRMAVLLTDGDRLPGPLQQDLLAIDEPLPSREDLAEILRVETEAARTAGADMADQTEPEREAAVSALAGLALFPAEQAVALSIIKEQRIVPTLLAERKRAYVNQTPGLLWESAKETFEDIGGLDAIKEWSRRRFEGKEPPAVVCRIEEIEKATAGAGGTGGHSCPRSSGSRKVHIQQGTREHLRGRDLDPRLRGDEGLLRWAVREDGPLCNQDSSRDRWRPYLHGRNLQQPVCDSARSATQIQGGQMVFRSARSERAHCHLAASHCSVRAGRDVPNQRH